MRAEGLSEFAGDYLIICTGGTATAPGVPAPAVDLQLFLNTSITSRLLEANWSEALLMVDEPTPATLRMCGTSGDVEPQPGTCVINGTGNGAGVYSGAAGRPNVFQGRQVGLNVMAWSGVPVDPPGTSGSRIFRITNIRANANALGVSAINVTPVSVFGTVSAAPLNFLPISGLATQSIGSVQLGLAFGPTIARTFQQCNSENAALAANPASSGTSQFSLRFSELFATSFRKRNVATTPADPSALANQDNIVGFLVGTYAAETGLYSASFPAPPGRGNLALAGLADHGTRLIARFSNVPSGVLLFAQASVTAASGDVVRMINTDANGNGPYSPVTGNAFGIAPIPVTNFTATAVYEFVQSFPYNFAVVDIPIYVAYTSNAAAFQPALGGALMNPSYAPRSTFTSASATEPLSRFADTSLAGSSFRIEFCACVSLAPTSAAFGSAGGAGLVTVTAPSDCSYFLTPFYDWITVSPPISRLGSSTVDYAVSANPTGSPRAGAIDIGTRLFSINQAGAACSYTLTPQTSIIAPAGGSASFSVTTNLTGCLWTAVNNSGGWIGITNGSGNGSGSVNFTVATNTGPERAATITVQGQVFTMIQAGAAPPNPLATSVFRDGSGAIQLNRFPFPNLFSAGGTFAGDPGTSQNIATDTFVIARDASNSLWVNVFKAASLTWGTWAYAGGQSQGTAAITVSPANTAYFFSRDSSNSYWLGSYTPGFPFGPWINLGGQFQTDPVVAATPDGTIYVAGRDAFNAIWTGRYQPGVGFLGWQSSGGVAKGKPSISVGGDAAVYISVRDQFDALWMARIMGSATTGWFLGGGVSSVDPLTASAAGNIYAVILNPSGALWYRPFFAGPGNNWQSWSSAGGVLQGASPAGLNGQVYIAGRDLNNELWWYSVSSVAWAWIGHQGLAAGNPIAAPR